MIKNNILILAFSAISTMAGAQSLYFPLDGATTESVSGTACSMNGVRTLPYANGIKDKCVRLDGYSNYISGDLSYDSITPDRMTFSLWIAPETYPMMNTEEAELTPTYAMVAGNLDSQNMTGFGLMLSSQGGYKCTCSFNGKFYDYIVSDDIIPLGEWSNVVIVMENFSKIKVYRNGKPVTVTTTTGNTFYHTMDLGTSSFLIGKSREELKNGVYDINTFNGLIDEVRIDNEVKSQETIASEYAALIDKHNGSTSVESIPVASLLTASDYGHLHPQFHGMPSHGWTNESHGLVYYNGKYHVFFQKNGNGPYMSRLHWGHITSTDLLNWSEEPIAIAPGASANGLEANDGRGCWSGCVFTDPEINDGKPTIVYTGANNYKAFMWMAKPVDDNLLSWEKQGVIIESEGNPCCSDASDDFRDPYFFTANGSKYIIIGTSNKANIGASLLYKYENKKWNYQGFFFSGTSQATCGRFWEMANVTPLGNGKYLFTCTPCDMENGVKCIYWIGTIGTDGKFVPDQEEPQTFEADGTSKYGYGLLSPTIYQDPNTRKLLVLGIVPDKVYTEVNYSWGWAHNYSLPRELALSADGKSIVEKPLASVAEYRGTEVTEGRQIEMYGTFTNSSEAQGFRFLKNGSNYAQLSLQDGKVILDITNLNRTMTDNESKYNGIYETNLNIPAGSDVTIDAILDGSIIDIFISGTGIEGKAFSVRFFPTDKDALECEAFGNGTTKIWAIDTQNPTGIALIEKEDLKKESSAYYNILGQKVNSSAKGIIIHNSKKSIHCI